MFPYLVVVNAPSFHLVTLAQARSLDTFTIVLWIGALIGLALVGGLLILLLRRSMFRKDTPGADEEGLLSSMRRLRDSGEISREEYDQFRKKLAKKASEKPPS